MVFQPALTAVSQTIYAEEVSKFLQLKSLAMTLVFLSLAIGLTWSKNWQILQRGPLIKQVTSLTSLDIL
jgi:hypothetical protein